MLAEEPGSLRVSVRAKSFFTRSDPKIFALDETHGGERGAVGAPAVFAVAIYEWTQLALDFVSDDAAVASACPRHGVSPCAPPNGPGAQPRRTGRRRPIQNPAPIKKDHTPERWS